MKKEELGVPTMRFDFSFLHKGKGTAKQETYITTNQSLY